VERHGVLAGRVHAGAAGDEDAGQMRCVRPQVLQRLNLAGVGDEAGGAAVVQDVRELLRLDARIDDQEHAAGLERGKDRDHGVVCGRSGLQAAISAFRLTNCTSRSMESRFSGTSSSSWMVKPYFCSRKLTSSRTPVESMMPSSSKESPLASGASSLPKRKFST